MMEERCKILIIDDELGFTNMLRLNLEATRKYYVKVVNDSTEAVKIALEYMPDLILLDIIMPNKEGPDVATEIKSHELLAEIPVIFLTATITTQEVENQGGMIGGHTFVAKPTHLPDLIKAINKQLFPFE